MRRDSAEVGAAARQRLEVLGRELGRVREVPDPPVLPASVVPEPGRHALAAERARLADRVPAWVGAVRERVGWTSAHLAVVAVLVATALALVAWSALRAAPQEIAAPVAASALVPSPAAGPSGAGPSGSASTGAAAAPRQEVVIDVAGKVRRPGVATLPAGSRVVDAIRHAGGAKRGVDLSSLNLARVLVDGEQVLVGLPAAPGRAAGATGAAGGGAGSSPVAGALVNLNTATAQELETLPGVGPVTAGKIVDWRTEHGAFTAIDELLDVDGIGDKTLAELAPHLTL